MKFKLIVLLSLFYFYNFSNSYGCTCIGVLFLHEAIKHSDLVIVGRIIDQKKVAVLDSEDIILKKDSALFSPNYEVVNNRFTVVVTQYYKGDISSDTVFIYTGFGHGDCGYIFELGKEYIIYGYNEFQERISGLYKPRENSYTTNICTRTKPFDQTELDEIRKYRKPKKLPSSK